HLRKKCFLRCGKNSADMWKPTRQRRAHNRRKRFAVQPRIPRMRVMAQLMEHPVVAVPRVGKPGDPCVMVIFGAAGDLTGRKLIPALYNLARAGLLSREFAVVGVARSQMSNDDFRKKVAQHVKEFCSEAPPDDDLWEWFAA